MCVMCARFWSRCRRHSFRVLELCNPLLRPLQAAPPSRPRTKNSRRSSHSPNAVCPSHRRLCAPPRTRCRRVVAEFLSQPRVEFSRWVSLSFSSFSSTDVAGRPEAVGGALAQLVPPPPSAAAAMSPQVAPWILPPSADLPFTWPTSEPLSQELKRLAAAAMPMPSHPFDLSPIATHLPHLPVADDERKVPSTQDAADELQSAVWSSYETLSEEKKLELWHRVMGKPTDPIPLPPLPPLLPLSSGPPRLLAQDDASIGVAHAHEGSARHVRRATYPMGAAASSGLSSVFKDGGEMLPLVPTSFGPLFATPARIVSPVDAATLVQPAAVMHSPSPFLIVLHFADGG